jgi:sigma-B regulation protein RsbU (phosphoserine phosphatase)
VRVPAPNLIACANPVLVLTQSQRLLSSVQEAFAEAGVVPGLSIYLKTADELVFPILQDGAGVAVLEAVTPDAVMESGRRCTGLGRFSEPGAEFVLCHAANDAGVIALAQGIVQGVLRTLDLEKREESLLEELGANWEILEASYEITTNVLRSGGIGEALSRLVERMVSLQEGLYAALFVTRNGKLEPLASTHPDARVLTWPELGHVEQVLHGRNVILLNGLQPVVEEPGVKAEWRAATSIAASPLTSGPKCIGFVVAWRDDNRYEFDSSLSRLLETIAYQASMLMDSDRLNRKVRESELLAQEINIASSIQQTLLLANAPKQVPCLEAAAFSLPSQNIDGDFYDFFQHPDGTLDVLIGDVMGKGVAAALLGAATKSQFLRSIANLALRSTGTPPEPREIVQRAAMRLGARLLELERFVTLCYARFDKRGERLSFVDCGHTSTIRVSKQTGESTLLRSDDLPLGVYKDFECEQHSLEIAPGDTFVFYSDGVTENRSPDGEFFGDERLVECVQTWSSLGPKLLLDQVRKEAVRFRGSEKFSDDFTCVAIRIRLGEEREQPLLLRTGDFQCDLEELTRVRGWLRELAEVMPEGSRLDDDSIARMELTCTEIFANCAIHSGDRPCEAPIRVEGSVYASHVTIRIVHAGAAYDPFSVPPPAFDGSRDSGFGIFIVSRCADELAFDRDADGNNVTTVSFFRASRI